MNNLSHTPCRSEHIVSIKAHWLSVLQLWLAGFCTDAHTCGHADARTLAHLTKAKTSSTYLTRFHLFSLLFPGSPICFSFVMQRAVIVQEAVQFLLQEQSAGWEFRLQRGEKNPGRRYVQVLREELQQRRQCTLKLPKPQQCVTTCCDIQCIFSFPSCISPTFYSQRQFFFNTFFFLLQESIARHYLCDCHKDFVSFEKQQLCQTISSSSSTYCGRLRVCREHSSMLQWKLLSSSYLICMCI